MSVALAALSLLALPSAAFAHGDGLVEEPVIPGLDGAVDFETAGNGDVYVAEQDGTLLRYRRAAGSTTAHPRYDLTPERLYDFEVTQANDAGSSASPSTTTSTAATATSTR